MQALPPRSPETGLPIHDKMHELLAQPAIRVETVTPQDPRFAGAQLIELDVFKKENYTKNEGQTALPEYAAYTKNSRFNIAYNNQNHIAGVLREIRNTTDDYWQRHAGSGYKTLDDFALFPQWKQHFEATSPQTFVEAGTVAVPKEFRRSSLHVADHLYHNLYINAIAEGRTNLIASIDAGLLRAYRSAFNFQDIGPTIDDYMGSDTTPVFSDLTVLAEYLKATDEKRYRRVIKGDFSA